jgi:hypothetical protein
MEVRLASEPSPDAADNEDHAVATADCVAVLDGVTVPAGMDTGCVHWPAWYVRRLGAHLVSAVHPDVSLPDVLAAGIRAVRDDHAGSCDLDHPGTPQSTACLLRTAAESVDYLVLCDCSLVLDRGGVDVITDLRAQSTSQKLREAALAGGSPYGSEDRASRLRALVNSQRRHVNRDGGYWIAAADPEAAYHAVTGTVPLTGPYRLRRAALLTDGASRAVDTFALTDWDGLLDVLDRHGPSHLISLVRTGELADSEGRVRPRYKRHDDATAAYCRLVPEGIPGAQ